MRKSPFGFLTTAKFETHSVASFAFRSIPFFTNSSNFIFSEIYNLNGTRKSNAAFCYMDNIFVVIVLITLIALLPKC